MVCVLIVVGIVISVIKNVNCEMNRVNGCYF